MTSPSQQFAPEHPHLSEEAIGKLLIALIEKSTGVVAPANWPDDSPFYLRRDVDALLSAFASAINAVIGDSGQIKCAATRALAILESDPQGLHEVNTLRIVAIERFRHRTAAA